MAFSDIIKGKVGSSERPRPLPVGTYLAMVKGQYEEVKAKTGNEGLQFTFQLLQAADDVDEDALNEVLKGKPLHEREIKATYWTSENILWRLDAFFNDLGLDGISREQAAANAAGKQVMVYLKHKPTQDGTDVFANIASTAPVGE